MENTITIPKYNQYQYIYNQLNPHTTHKHTTRKYHPSRFKFIIIYIQAFHIHIKTIEGL